MSEQYNWINYNHAIIPNTAPHETVDLTALKSGQLWKDNPRALLARWTTEFDCGEETNWWYVIKDDPFDISKLKAKRRYEIRKGQRNFAVERIKPTEWVDALLRITVAAYSAWPKKYRPIVDELQFRKSVASWTKYEIYGAFLGETGELCAYALVKKCGKCAEFSMLRADPMYENQAINAAMVAGLLMENEEFLKNGGYICDGSRSINHETAFQDYLEKYFDFRKAFCKLHVAFRPGIGAVVKCLYPLRKLLQRMDNIGLVHQINAVLTMKDFSEE